MKLLHAICLIALALMLTACEIEGGVPPAATAGVLPAPSPTSALQAEPTPPAAAAFRIGLLDLPASLLPYQADASDQRMADPVTQLLFPAPLLAHSYTYTSTGILERVPSFDNGDIIQRTTSAYLDSAGIITTTVTQVVTDVQQLVVTYRWNKDLRWSDGTPVTATDSVFAYELAKTAAPGEDSRARLAMTERYEQVDEHTTRAILKPDFTGPTYLQTFWTPLPRHLLQDTQAADLPTSEFARQPLGYGPYSITAREPGRIKLERNPYYAGPRPLADTVWFVIAPNVDALRASVLKGDLDLAVADRIMPEQLTFLDRDQQQGNLNVVYTPGPIWEHLSFNLDLPLFKDFRVRRAIAYGTNRQGMIDALFGGHSTPLESWILPEQWANAPADTLTRYPYDPEQAKKLLDEAGIVDSNGDGTRERNNEPLTLNLLTTEGTALRANIARRFTEDMATLGITVTVQTVPARTLYSPEGPLFRREFQLAQFAWIAAPDPGGLSLWSCATVPSQTNNWIGDNFAGWCFREADQTIRTANTTLDRNERAAAYLRQQQLFTQELPVIPLFQRPLLTISRPELEGIRPDPLAPITWNIAAWTRGR